MIRLASHKSNPIKFFALVILVMVTAEGSQAQKYTRKQLEKLYAGSWFNSKSTRHLIITFQDDHASIVDWTSKFQMQENGDIYKAYLRNGKLIMPEDHQHHAPYSEIIYKNHKLIYLTRSIDHQKTQWDKITFSRLRQNKM